MWPPVGETGPVRPGEVAEGCRRIWGNGAWFLALELLGATSRVLESALALVPAGLRGDRTHRGLHGGCYGTHRAARAR